MTDDYEGFGPEPSESPEQAAERYYFEKMDGRAGGYKINDRSAGRLATCWNQRNAETIVSALNAWNAR